MISKIVELLKERFELEKVNTGEFANIKVSPMTFKISQYHIKGVGNMSIMQGKAMAGLMKMDTVIINPLEVDAPIFSYDRILAMGNDTIYLEMYSTQVNEIDVSNVKAVQDKYANLPNHEVASNWYDNIRYNESTYKKSKKKDKVSMESLIVDYVLAFADVMKAAQNVDLAAKKEKSLYYVNGLLDNGGPSTNVFLKKFGREKTVQLFKEVLFAVKED